MIPDYQSLMLPLLRKHADRNEHKLRDLIEELAHEFRVTDNEREELLPSGRQYIFNNRVGWARTYLKKSGLLDSPKRAVFIITQRGLDVLKQNPERINIAYLRQFPEFIEFRKRDHSDILEPDDNAIQTPEEDLEIAYQTIRKSLAQDLISRVISLPPSFFESL